MKVEASLGGGGRGPEYGWLKKVDVVKCWCWHVCCRIFGLVTRLRRWRMGWGGDGWWWWWCGLQSNGCRWVTDWFLASAHGRSHVKTFPGKWSWAWHSPGSPFALLCAASVRHGLLIYSIYIYTLSPVALASLFSPSSLLSIESASLQFTLLPVALARLQFTLCGLLCWPGFSSFCCLLHWPVLSSLALLSVALAFLQFIYSIVLLHWPIFSPLCSQCCLLCWPVLSSLVLLSVALASLQFTYSTVLLHWPVFSPHTEVTLLFVVLARLQFTDCCLLHWPTFGSPTPLSVALALLQSTHCCIISYSVVCCVGPSSV